MKLRLIKILHLFYKYYSSGSTKDIAYLSSLLALILMFYLNFASILVVTGIEKEYLAFPANTPRWKQYSVISLLLFLIVSVLSKIFKEEEVKSIEMNPNSIRNGQFILLIYLVLSIVIFFVTVMFKK